MLLVIAVWVDATQQDSTVISNWRRFENLLWLAGILLMILSSVAAPIGIVIWLTTSLVAWLYSTKRRTEQDGEQSFEVETAKKNLRLSNFARVLLLCLVVSTVAELPYHITPSLQPARNTTVAIIGDSVTAGIGGNETSERWPEILRRVHGLEVQDISHMGETAASATKRLRDHEVDAAIVIVEIGGNDILGGTSVSDFETTLNQLLTSVCKNETQVVMFELPLPPFFHRYGFVQRRLAKKHGVQLLPKTTFLAAISGRKATLDSIHLTQEGHQRMADEVWAVIGPAFATP